jgi:NAD(P)-dependent dehydrogenase (short-subunit alcohol dehydrogenase family)
MARSLEGKIALVTGGGSGIGKATALAFAREGAKVVVDDINAEGGEETVRLIKKANGEATFVKADVRIEAEVKKMVDRVVELYGRLDCAHNNAGIKGDMCGTLDCTSEDWENMISTNLRGVWLCMKYEILQMLKQGGGAIVNTASKVGLSAGSMVIPGNISYTASKHGVVGLTKQAGVEFANKGIRINAVCPGFIDTPLTAPHDDEDVRIQAEVVAATEPIGRKGTAEEVAEAVVWLCSDAASFVLGHAMSVDGGWAAH